MPNTQSFWWELFRLTLTVLEVTVSHGNPVGGEALGWWVTIGDATLLVRSVSSSLSCLRMEVNNVLSLFLTGSLGLFEHRTKSGGITPPSGNVLQSSPYSNTPFLHCPHFLVFLHLLLLLVFLFPVLLLFFYNTFLKEKCRWCWALGSSSRWLQCVTEFVCLCVCVIDSWTIFTFLKCVNSSNFIDVKNNCFEEKHKLFENCLVLEDKVPPTWYANENVINLNKGLGN